MRKRFLRGGFEKSEDLFALVRTRINGAEVFLSLHFPDRRDRSFLFDSLIRNVFRLSRCFDDRFCRMWDYYLRYCEAGFESRLLGTMHLMLTRPNNITLPVHGE